MNDQQVVSAQLDRPLRAAVEVVARCHLDQPVVTAVPPLLDDGTPFPTRYWLTCPLAIKRLSRLESAGGVGRLESYLASRPALARRLAKADRRYAGERDRLVPPGADPRPGGGVGGNTGEGLKCLHSHYADHAAGNDNPVGELSAPYVEPLDCEDTCVVEIDGKVTNNPDWREPV